MKPLNSPLEVGIRTVVLLAESFPDVLDIDRLVLMDYWLLHSGDFNGPRSIQPALSTRNGELGIKRTILEHGVQLMTRAGMIEVSTTIQGITYQASESAAPFLQLIRSEMLDQLSQVARWVCMEFAGLTDDRIRELMGSVMRQRTEEWNEALPRGAADEVMVWNIEESEL